MRSSRGVLRGSHGAGDDRALRNDLSANIIRAQDILAAIPEDSPHRYLAQYHLDTQVNARHNVDRALAEWDLSVVSFVEAGGLMGSAGVPLTSVAVS